jgi:putative transcriptional regulator
MSRRAARARRATAGIALLLAATLAGAASAGASDPPRSTVEPGRGVLLVASERLGDPRFRESVVLVLEHGPGGALGVIVNRPTDVRLSTLMPEVHELQRAQPRAFAGGPVARDRMILLVRGTTPPPGSARVLDEVWITPGVDGLRALARDASQDGRHRAFVGYAGWGPGQLESEIARGDWSVTAGSAARVFAADPDGLWRELTESTRGRWVRAAPPTRNACRASRRDSTVVASS